MDNNIDNPQTPLGRPLGMPPGTNDEPQEPTAHVVGDPTEQSTSAAPHSSPTSQQGIPLQEKPQQGRPMQGKPQQGKPQGKSKLPTWLIALIALLIVGALAGGIYYFVSQKDEPTAVVDDEQDEDASEQDEDEATAEEAEEAEAPVARASAREERTTAREERTTAREERTTAREERTTAREERTTRPAAPQDQRLVLKGDADGYPLTLALEIGQNGHVSGTFTDETTGASTAVSGSSTTNGVMRLTGNNITLRIVPDGHIFTGTLGKGGSPSKELHLTAR